MNFFELDERVMEIVSMLAEEEISLQEANEILEEYGTPLELTIDE